MKTSPMLEQQILDALHTLTQQEQEAVLSFALALARRPQVFTGQELAQFFSQYTFTPEEAEEITRIYDEMER